MSDICERAYSPSSIRALFEGFRLQAENCLLFLKSVTKLSIHVKAAGSQSPQLLFEATASPQVPFSHPIFYVYISLIAEQDAFQKQNDHRWQGHKGNAASASHAWELRLHRAVPRAGLL